MLPQKTPQHDANEQPTLRTKRYDALALLAAASETDVVCAEWLFDHQNKTLGNAS